MIRVRAGMGKTRAGCRLQSAHNQPQQTPLSPLTHLGTAGDTPRLRCKSRRRSRTRASRCSRTAAGSCLMCRSTFGFLVRLVQGRCSVETHREVMRQLHWNTPAPKARHASKSSALDPTNALVSAPARQVPHAQAAAVQLRPSGGAQIRRHVPTVRHAGALNRLSSRNRWVGCIRFVSSKVVGACNHRVNRIESSGRGVVTAEHSQGESVKQTARARPRLTHLLERQGANRGGPLGPRCRRAQLGCGWVGRRVVAGDAA